MVEKDATSEPFPLIHERVTTGFASSPHDEWDGIGWDDSSMDHGVEDRILR